MTRPNLLVIMVLGLLVLGWGAAPPTGAQQPTGAGPQPPPRSAAPAVCNAVFSEDFESGTFGRFVESGPEYGWGIGRGHPPGCCAVAAGGGPVPGEAKEAPPAPGMTPSGATEQEYTLVTSSPFTIPATASSASLSFWWNSLWYPGLSPSFTVELSADGGVTWGTLWSLDANMPTWTQTTLDVTAYRGIPLLMRLHFIGSFYVPDHWVFVDDIILDTVIPGCATPTPGPLQTPSPTPTATPTYVEHAGQFEDVPPGSTFYEFVECMGTRGIISGYPCGGPVEPCHAQHKPYFRPNNNVTRGQVSKMVVSAAGWNDPVPSTQQTFADVPPGSTFWLWIEQLVGRGAVAGYPCGGPFEPCIGPTNRPYFRPNNNLTRGQLAKIAAQAAVFTETPTAQTFEDVPPTGTFYLWIERMASRGIVGGYPCGGLGEPCISPDKRPYFRPNGNVTRGQTAKIITNSFFPNCQDPVTPTPTVPPVVTDTPTVPPVVTDTPTVPPIVTETPGVTVTPTEPPATPTVTATPTPSFATNGMQRNGLVSVG